MKTRLFAAVALAACSTVFAVQAQAPGPATVNAELKNSTGQTVGGVVLTAAPKGVLIQIDVKGLSPGWHGLHFHEKGDCSKSDFTTAGALTHGAGAAVHGLLNPAANETGDLPNIHAGADGQATAQVFTTLTTLEALRDADGSAVVIHANPDDFTAQPIGGAGPRVACAVIK
jgi:Cu-Zn family superoxide dismutase